MRFPKRITFSKMCHITWSNKGIILYILTLYLHRIKSVAEVHCWGDLTYKSDTTLKLKGSGISYAVCSFGNFILSLIPVLLRLSVILCVRSEILTIIFPNEMWVRAVGVDGEHETTSEPHWETYGEKHAVFSSMETWHIGSSPAESCHPQTD